MKIIKPPKLEKGDTIAFIAPASGLSALILHRLEKGKKFFEELDYKVKIFPTAKKNLGISSDTPENRAKDIRDAFKDKKIKAIITTIGGNTSHQTLEYLDFETIKDNPKIFCGYSDTTSLHLALYSQSRLVSFYGPAVITQFGENPKPDEFTVKHFFKAITEIIGEVKPSKRWSDDKSINWINKEDLKKKRKYKENKGYEWLKEGKAKGKILGGCLPVILHLAGTKYWPDFKNKILLLETPEGEDFRRGESLANVDSALGDLRNLGVFKQVKGIVFGRGFGYTKEQVKELKKIILYNTRGYNFPILYNVDTGHTDPMITIPFGVESELDSNKDKFKLNKKLTYPCPCGGKIKWKKEKVIKDGIDCGILDVEICDKCGEEYLPDESMEIVEDKLKQAGLWGVERKEIKFWKSGNSIVTRFPINLVKKLGLDKIKTGFVYREGKHKIAIEI
jgi:muramoyltetrapeptide carboxypeptidase